MSGEWREVKFRTELVGENSSGYAGGDLLLNKFRLFRGELFCRRCRLRAVLWRFHEVNLGDDSTD